MTRRFLRIKLDDTKEVIRSKSKKDRQHNGQRAKRQTMISKTLNRKLKIKQHQANKKG